MERETCAAHANLWWECRIMAGQNPATAAKFAVPGSKILSWHDSVLLWVRLCRSTFLLPPHRRRPATFPLRDRHRTAAGPVPDRPQGIR